METLSLSDFPLDLLAGSEVTFWRTGRGTALHGNQNCSALRGRSLVTEQFSQPDSGSLADRNLPASFHCAPGDMFGRYLDEALDLIRFSAATTELENSVSVGDLPVAAFDSREIPKAADPTFRAQWDEQRALRSVTEDRIRRALYPSGRRIALIVLADWVLAGRTSREHQPRYTAFLDDAERIHETNGLDAIGGSRAYLNGRLLPGWLAAVAGGMLPARATSSMVREQTSRSTTISGQSEESFELLMGRTLTAVGDSWLSKLEAMCLVHDSSVFAIFHLHARGVDTDLADTFLNVSGGAGAVFGGLDWVATTLPSAFSLTLNERESGLNGLILINDLRTPVDSTQCDLFLRNLLRDLECPVAAESVVQVNAGETPRWKLPDYSPEVDKESLPVWPFDGFSSLEYGRGLTTDQCAAALRFALNGVEKMVRKSVRRK